MSKHSRSDRVEHVNAVIEEVAARGRRFFHHSQSGRNARFEITATGRIRYRDEYTDRLIDVAREGRWNHFSGGGTLQSLVRSLGLYVAKGEPVDRRHFGPWAQWRCDGDVWGYGFDQMEQLRDAIEANACLAPRPVPQPETKTTETAYAP